MARLNNLKDKAEAKYTKTKDAYDDLRDKEKKENSSELERLEGQKDEAVAKYEDQDTAYENLKGKLNRENGAEIDRLKDQRDAAVEKWEDQKDFIEDTLEPRAKKYFDDEMKRLKDMKAKVESFETAHDNAARGAGNHATAVENATTAYEDFADALDDAATSWKNYYSAQNGSSGESGSAPGSGTLSARASGGPVTAEALTR